LLFLPKAKPKKIPLLEYHENRDEFCVPPSVKPPSTKTFAPFASLRATFRETYVHKTFALFASLRATFPETSVHKTFAPFASLRATFRKTSVHKNLCVFA